MQQSLHECDELHIFFFFFFGYLKIGYGVWGGEPGSAGVFLVAKGSVEGLGDGAQIESADGRG